LLFVQASCTWILGASLSSNFEKTNKLPDRKYLIVLHTKTLVSEIVRINKEKDVSFFSNLFFVIKEAAEKKMPETCPSAPCHHTVDISGDNFIIL
jgi:hypothetical protein